MSTVLDLVQDALVILGVIGAGENPTGDQAEGARRALNAMIAKWSAAGRVSYFVSVEDASLTPGLQEHSWGPGGDIDSPRPDVFLGASIFEGGQQYPLSPVNYPQWLRISDPSLTGMPRRIWYNPDYGADKRAIFSLYPVPDNAYTIRLQSRKPLGSLASQATEIELPPAWESALKYGLARDLAPSYQRPITADVERLYRESYKALGGLDTEIPPIGTDYVSVGRSGRFNINTGE